LTRSQALTFLKTPLTPSLFQREGRLDQKIILNAGTMESLKLNSKDATMSRMIMKENPENGCACI